MSFAPSKNLQHEVAELISHYPDGESRSASLMVLHAIQDEAGYISTEAMQWAAGEIGIKPLNLYELVTFYPMLREEQPGKFVLKVCHPQLRDGGWQGVARKFVQQTEARSQRARTANNGGQQVQHRVCRMPCQLRYGAGDDVQR